VEKKSCYEAINVLLSSVVELSGVDANSTVARHGYRVQISVTIHCSIISFRVE